MGYPTPGIDTQLPAGALAVLKSDDTLGSANFFDRCRALSTTREVPILFLDKPFRIVDDTPIRELSLDQLQRYRTILAAWYLRRATAHGDVVAVCVEDGIAPFLHYLALTSVGATIALINPAMAAPVGVAYMRDNGFDALVTDSHTAATSPFVGEWRAAGGATCIGDEQNAAGAIGTGDLRAAADLPHWWPLAPQDSTLVMLSHTSGTTGLPKAVRFEHRQFFMGKRARIGTFSRGADERLLTALPQSHSSAISHLETAVLHGISTFVLSTQDGAALRAAIARFAPTTVAAFPKSYMLLAEGGVTDNEFPSVQRWFSMGDAAHQSHVRRVLVGAPQSRFIDAFGSSELGMALFRCESTLDALAPCRCIGRPVDIAVAKILDADTGEEVAAGKAGLLAVRSPTITSGYWRKPGVTGQAWRGGYFLTGDVAYCADGAFYQIDRAVDVVATAAGPLYTLELEEAAQQVPDVCDVSVVGMAPGETARARVLAVVLPERRAGRDASAIADDVSRALRLAIAERLGLEDADVADMIAVAIVYEHALLPTGATGKVLKRQLRDAAASFLERPASTHQPAPDTIVHAAS